MTVWARSDVAAVAISADHGGCGTVHSRPAPGGVPVKVWALNCDGGCEDHLRSDPLWSGTAHTVPETPDEVKIREDVEKRGQLEQQAGMAQALSDLAKLGDLPAAIAQLASIMGGERHQLDESMLRICRNGHLNKQNARFCADCGANLDDAVNRKDAAGAIEAAEDRSDVLTLVSLDEMSMSELRELAEKVGAPNARSKAEQIELIKQAQGSVE